MIAFAFNQNHVVVADRVIDVGSMVLDARMSAKIVLVLIDPDSYLTDPAYRQKRRSGMPAYRNLRAFTTDGAALWDAELPEAADYYYKIVGIDPIEVDSFSGYRCQIDPTNGRISSRRFMK